MGIEDFRKQILPDSFDWMQEGNCSRLDTNLFFPERGHSNELAKAACARCVVKQECMEYAIENEKHGVWGGLSGRERRRILKQRRKDSA